MQEVLKSESGGTGLDCGQSLLHEEVCLLCREEMSNNDSAGCSQRVEAGLAYPK
jgi:hypothetical protein